MTNILDEMFGRRPHDLGAATEVTAERIACAVELLAAVTACQFFAENQGGSNAEKRLRKVVQEKAAIFCRRQGA